MYQEVDYLNAKSTFIDVYAHIHLGTFTYQLHFSDKTQFAYVNGYAVDKNPLCTNSTVFILKKILCL